MNIEIYENKFQDTIDRLDKEIYNLEKISNSIDDKLKTINNDNIWSGDAQKTFLNYYQSVNKEIPDIIDKFKSYSTFLKKTLDNYINSVNVNDSDVDKNGENLNIV